MRHGYLVSALVGTIIVAAAVVLYMNPAIMKGGLGLQVEEEPIDDMNSTMCCCMIPAVAGVIPVLGILSVGVIASIRRTV